MKKPSYDTAFKIEAANMVIQQGMSIKEVCKVTGAGRTAVTRWVNQLNTEVKGSTPKAKALTPEQQTIQELQAKISRLQTEKEILKKATAFFVNEVNLITH